MNQQERTKGIRIDVTADSPIESECRGILKEAAKATLAGHAVRLARICISIVNDAQIEKLNQQHLGHQGPTDVLTFDLSEGDDKMGKSDPKANCVDGEIVISRDTAKREAELRRHSLEAELALYVVHGTLHLLGYEDSDECCSAEMHAMEDKILESIGIGAVFARATVSRNRKEHASKAKRS